MRSKITTTPKNIIFWIGTIITTIFFSLLTLMSYGEWWKIKIKKQISSYPWGQVNENPWYYDNPNLYSIVMLTEGILCTIALAFLLRQLLRMDKTKILYSLMFCFGIFVLILINGAIK